MTKTKLSKAAKDRIQIAQEALNAVYDKGHGGKFIPTSDTWVCSISEKDIFKGEDKKQDLKTVLEKQTKCKVCGIGGLFAAAVLLHNKMPISKIPNVREFPNANADDYSVLVGPHGWGFVSTYLSKFFPKEQLEWVEFTFEDGEGQIKDPQRSWCNDDEDEVYISEDKMELSHKFCEQYPDLKDRFVKIMENIIRNDGDFKLQSIVQ